ncbi:MAG: hypothetical protein OHK0050_37290 [Roseiflexaceae bacterium]
MKRRRRSLLLGSVFIIVIMVLACGLGGGAVQQGLVEPPELDLMAGDYRLITNMAYIPVCSQLINPGCVVSNPVPPVRIYTIWLLQRTIPGSWNSAKVHQIAAFRLER